MLRLKPYVQVVRITIAVSLLISQSSMPALAFGVNPPKTGCFITVDDPHISTSVKERYGRRAVKVNANSVCNFAVKDVFLTVEIYQSSEFGFQRVAIETVPVPNVTPPNKRIFNKKTYGLCKTKEKKIFYGVGYAKAIINGRKYETVPTRSERKVSLTCTV